MGQRAALITTPVAARQPAGPLRATTLAASRLHINVRREAYALFSASYDGTSWFAFQRDLAAKQFVILLRDARTGHLKGFSTVELFTDGKATVVFSGDTVIDSAYWGQKTLQRAFATLILRQKLRHPTRPVYWFLISKGYKTYLLMINRCPKSIPRHDRPDDAAMRRSLDRLATARFAQKYDPVTSVARDLGADRVRAGLAPIDGAVLANPHVRFFLQRNPGHARGDELCCLAEIRVRDAVVTVVRAVAKRVAR
jgi:hypothetical protein